MKKKIFKILRWSLLLAYIFVIMSFVGRERKNLECSGLIISIDRPHSFIDNNAVENLLIKNKISLDSCLIENINFDAIEKIIEENPSVKNADVYSDFAGKVFIKIEQRNPIMRIITEDNIHFYVDDKHKLMPINSSYAANVPVVSGYIDKEFAEYIDSSEVSQENIKGYTFTPNDLYNFVSYLNNSDLWRYQIEQIYVNYDKEIELIPRVGNHIIILGDLKNYEYKLQKLISLYKNGFTDLDWNAYSSINLKYSEQIICKKR